MGTRYNRLAEAVITSTNNPYFGSTIRKIGKPLHTPVLLYKMGYIEDICFFEVNTAYISSSELKTSGTHEMKYIWYSPKKKASYTIHGHFPIHKAGGENAKTQRFLKVQIILVPHCSLRSWLIGV